MESNFKYFCLFGVFYFAYFWYFKDFTSFNTVFYLHCVLHYFSILYNELMNDPGEYCLLFVVCFVHTSVLLWLQAKDRSTGKEQDLWGSAVVWNLEREQGISGGI